MITTTETTHTYNPVYPLQLRAYTYHHDKIYCHACGADSGPAYANAYNGTWAWDYVTQSFPYEMAPGDYCPFCVSALVAMGMASFVTSTGLPLPLDQWPDDLASYATVNATGTAD